MEDRNKRIETLRRSLSASGLDAILITSPENRFYLSGFGAEDMGCAESAGALLVTKRERFLLTDGRYVEQAGREAPEWTIVEYKKGLAKELQGIFVEMPSKKMGYEPAFLSCQLFEKIKKALNGITLVPYGDKILEMRSQKGQMEVGSIRKAVQAVERVMDYVSERLEPGMKQRDAAWMILEKIYHESDGPSFPPIVASGPDAALPHAIPGSRVIEPGEAVIVDIGCMVEGYCSDMTRTFFPGGEPDHEMKKIYMTVKEAQAEAQAGLKPGISCRSADKIARDIISEAGYGERFIHSLGHGVGVAVHEAPALSFRNRKHLRAGMVVTVEPGIYIPGKGGVRLENMALITDGGAEILNSSRWYYAF